MADKKLDNVWELTPRDSVINLNKWETQMPNSTACLQTCFLIAGYEANSAKAIQIYFEGKSTPVFSQALHTIDSSLMIKVPVIVGVYRSDRISHSNNGKADHFVVIVGSGSDGGKKYYRFVDPGTAYFRFGISPENKFNINATTSTMEGNAGYGNHVGYIVSQIRPK